jgi:quercetin dioxygenase-like cupin family protein
MKNKINLLDLTKNVFEKHFNDKVFSINNHCLRIAVNENNTFPWHRHKTTDELFIVLEGNLTIEIENGDTINLLPLDSYCIKAGTIHRTTAIGRTVNLCVEADKDDTEFIER